MYVIDTKASLDALASHILLGLLRLFVLFPSSSGSCVSVPCFTCVRLFLACLQFVAQHFLLFVHVVAVRVRLLLQFLFHVVSNVNIRDCAQEP